MKAIQESALNPLTPDKVTFSFGRNWQAFKDRCLDPERERIAADYLTEFMELPNLENRAFLDVGCGSGLFSLAAYRLGARKVVSFDVDPYSVRCTEELRRLAGSPRQWEVHEGSILDEGFIAGIEKADIVYAWGSLHHTGNMWGAVRNAAALTSPDGLLFLSIYNKVEGRKGSQFWLKVKKLYNRLPGMGKRALEFSYVLRFGLLPRIIALRNPLPFFSDYRYRRGMDYWTDVRDWLGGYPYEFAAPEEIFRFCSRELNLELVNLHSTNTIGTNEFLFRRRD